MTDLPSSAYTPEISFVFTMLLIEDLEKFAAFYTSACGVVELNRVESEVMGRPISEIVYQPTSAGGAPFILAKFRDVPRPHSDPAIPRFATQGLDAYLERIEKAGGRVVEAILEDPEAHMRRAFIEDIEGHLVQLCEIPG